jgi:hypothetical protein
MKKLLISFLALTILSIANAQNNADESSQAIPTTDPQYEWSQYKDKTGSAQIGKKGLLLECKKSDEVVASVVELPFNPENDNFKFDATFTETKLSQDFNVGIIFDYSDTRNFKGIRISKEQFVFFSVKDGTTANIKSGLIKYKGKSYIISIDKQDEKILFSLNGLEFSKIKRAKIESPYFGVFVYGKGKALVPEFNFQITDSGNDIEQSTTDM